MHESTLAFIGAGNMASSLIGGLIAKGVSPHRILASDPNTEKLTQLEALFSIRAHPNNANVAQQASVIILAVKPQKMHEALQSIAPTVTNALIISIAAGIPVRLLQEALGEKVAIVRCMPNTPALVRAGVTGLFANAWVSEPQKSLAESIMNAVGISLWVAPESELDIVTAVSGSGPAYFFLLMESLQQAAQALGLDQTKAKLFVIQTALGAAKMAQEDDNLTELRQRVTSKGGTTEQALAVLREHGFHEIIQKAIRAAYERCQELAKGV